jgi:hypothetical protein
LPAFKPYKNNDKAAGQRWLVWRSQMRLAAQKPALGCIAFLVV